jgi:phosphate transport system substrate-binding protein
VFGEGGLLGASQLAGQPAGGLSREKNMKQGALIRLSIILLVGLVLAGIVYYSPSYFIQEDRASTPVHLKAGGTSVVYIIMENRWKTAYRKEKGIEVDYDSTGSTSGIKQMIDKNYAIGFTHAPLTDEQKKEAQAKGGEVVHIPVVICAVVPVYNVQELKDKPPLKFTGEVLADIFLGKIDRWNDPALKKLNDGVELPDTKIAVIHRKDSSGTTFLFTDYLAGASEAWQKEMGPANSEVKWPVGVAMPRNEGVAAEVRKTDGSIGYVDLLHTLSFDQGDLQHGAVQNKDKTTFIHADTENLKAAAQGLTADMGEDLTFKLTNRPGKDAFPICGVIWAVCYQHQPASNQQLVGDFLRWIIHDGQQFAERTSYAPLPPDLVERADQKLQSIKTVQ